MTPKDIVLKHRRHVELSPGVGKDVQDYALAVCDDILADLHEYVSESIVTRECETCKGHLLVSPRVYDTVEKEPQTIYRCKKSERGELCLDQGCVPFPAACQQPTDFEVENRKGKNGQ